MPDQVKYTQKLKGKKVLITGGTSGIGFAVAEALVESGAIVIVSSSSPARVDKAIERLQHSYPSAASNISGHATDLGNEETLDANVKALLDKCGKLDHIVHTAGDSLAQLALESASLAQITQAGMVRFFAPMIIGKYARQYLKPGPESSFTITTGAAADKPVPQWSIIASYAAGLSGMTRGLAVNLKPIRVNLISPGAVETELWDSLGEESKQRLLKSLPGTMLTGRVPGPEEVAEAYLYVMKDSNITGTVVSSNGGTLLS